MTKLVCSPALRYEVKRLKALSLTKDLNHSRAQEGLLANEEKKALEKVFSTTILETGNSTENFWA